MGGSVDSIHRKTLLVSCMNPTVHKSRAFPGYRPSACPFALPLVRPPAHRCRASSISSSPTRFLRRTLRRSHLTISSSGRRGQLLQPWRHQHQQQRRWQFRRSDGKRDPRRGNLNRPTGVLAIARCRLQNGHIVPTSRHINQYRPSRRRRRRPAAAVAAASRSDSPSPPSAADSPPLAAVTATLY